jgi:hypothetical protein
VPGLALGYPPLLGPMAEDAGAFTGSVINQDETRYGVGTTS